MVNPFFIKSSANIFHQISESFAVIRDFGAVLTFAQFWRPVGEPWVGDSEWVGKKEVRANPTRCLSPSARENEEASRLSKGEVTRFLVTVKCTSSDHMGPMAPLSKRHFSARCFFSLDG